MIVCPRPKSCRPPLESDFRAAGVWHQERSTGTTVQRRSRDWLWPQPIVRARFECRDCAPRQGATLLGDRSEVFRLSAVTGASLQTAGPALATIDPIQMTNDQWPMTRESPSAYDQ